MTAWFKRLYSIITQQIKLNLYFTLSAIFTKIAGNSHEIL